MKATKAVDIAKARKNNSDRILLKLSSRSCQDIEKECKTLVRALKSAKDPSSWKLRHVTLALGHEGMQTCTKSLRGLLQVLVELYPAVESVKFCTIIDRDNPGLALWPCTVVSDFLQQIRPRLKALEFEDTGVYGKKTSLEQFYRALEGMPALEKIHFRKGWNNYAMIEGTNYDSMRTVYDLSPLFAAVASLPVLQGVVLCCFGRGITNETNDMSAILAKNGLTAVKLSGIDPANDTAMAAISDALTAPSTVVKSLKVEFSWTCPDAPFSFEGEEDLTGPHWSNFRRLAEAIGASTTLEEVELVFDDFIETYSGMVYTCTKIDDFLALVAEQIKTNRQNKIKKITANPDEYQCSERKIATAFVTLLETNYNLEVVDVCGENEWGEHEENTELSDQMSLYLRLNKHGRKTLMAKLGAAPKEEWTKLFGKLDTRCIEYYLIKFPWLAKFAARSESTMK